jgi:hypothetical protein
MTGFERRRRPLFGGAECQAIPLVCSDRNDSGEGNCVR